MKFICNMSVQSKRSSFIFREKKAHLEKISIEIADCNQICRYKP